MGRRFEPSLLHVVALAAPAAFGAFGAMPTFWKMIPSRFIFLGLLTLPFFVYTFLLINYDLTAMLLEQRGTRIYNFWCAVFCASMLIERSTI